MPKKTSIFSVKPQEALENQNPNGYSHKASSFTLGSEEAVKQSKRKKPTLSPFTPLLNANQTQQEHSNNPSATYHGLMTPQTPSNEILPPTSSDGQRNQYSMSFPPWHDPPSHRDHIYQSNSNQLSGASLLFTAPNLQHCAPVHPENFVDRDATFPDLSPLILQHHATLPPDFSDQHEISASFENPQPAVNPRKKPVSKAETIKAIHETMQQARITPTMFLIHLLEEAQDGTINARLGEAFYRSTNKPNICRLLDLILADDKGAVILKEWMRPHAIDLVCETVHAEMESAKPHLRMTTAETSPDFINSWDIDAIMDPIAKDITPTWTAVLVAATEPKNSQEKQEDAENNPHIWRHTTQNIISAQVHYRRSYKSAKVQIGLGLMAWSTGASRNLLNVLHKAGLSNSYRAITGTILSLHEYSLEEAQKVSHEPHFVSYDNVNYAGSIHSEQRPGGPSKVQSGTFPVIYQLKGVDVQHMKLAPMIENLKKSRSLRLGDLRMSPVSIEMYTHQTAVSVAKILFKYSTEFEAITTDPLIEYKPRRPLPKTHKTLFYPLSVSTIEEASISGNLHVHDNIYIEQLHHDPQSPKLNDYAIPCLNDQLTNARIRGAQSTRIKDVNAWERREIFQLAFGTFHLVMNLIWALLNTHRGNPSEHGSLSHFFNLLEKARLGNERPDYYTLLAALTQILEGLILNAWRLECGFASLDAFANSKPSAADILRIAKDIITKHATPATYTPRTEIPKKRKAQDGFQSEETETQETCRESDHARSNVILLTRDLLYVFELISAISVGDFGRVEDILPAIACVFRGAGSNNYSMEILHFLFNVKQVWTPENIMRDIMLVNPSGLGEGHWMPVDMNIEHLIGYLKSLFSAKGLYSNWGKLANISAAVNYLQLIKKRVVRSLGSGYQGSTHKTPNTDMLVMRVANRARELRLQEYVEHREVESKPVPDLRRDGHRKFATASLATFNKKIDEYKLGREFDEEVDEMPVVNFADASIDIDNEIVLEDE